MARKRKSGNKDRGQKHSAITRIGRPANPFVRKRSHYSGKRLTLAIIGGAAFLVLKGYVDGGNNDGDGTFYSVVSERADDSNSATVYTDGWSSARAEFYSNLSKQMSKQSCQAQSGGCYPDGIDQSRVPIFSGSLLSRVIRKNRNGQYVYSSGDSPYTSRPVRRTTSGDYS